MSLRTTLLKPKNIFLLWFRNEDEQIDRVNLEVEGNLVFLDVLITENEFKIFVFCKSKVRLKEDQKSVIWGEKM